MNRASSSSKEGNLDSIVRPLVILEVEATDADVGSEDMFGDDVLAVVVGEIGLGRDDVFDR